MQINQISLEQKLDKSTLAIGIDIGWSERQRSCAFATIDPLHKLTWPERTDRYNTADLGCCRFRLSELIDFLVGVRHAMSSYERTVVVVDGPLGPDSKPVANRAVDSSFRRGEFRNRMQPADIDNEIGRTYVDATYQVVESLKSACLPWVGGPAVSSIVIAETNPTVGLALMNRKFDCESLPSRKRPLVPPSTARSERAMRAKSDFYWHVGGNEQCALILNVQAIALERNHENVAGLYCLAVACALSAGKALACGDKATGVYVFPNGVDSEWHRDLETVGIAFGEASEISRSSISGSFASWIRAASGSESDDCDLKNRLLDVDDAIEELAASGNWETLLLNDNGGIWERHNDWLEGLQGPVKVRCTKTGTEAKLARAGSKTQWTSEPKALPLAKLHGFREAHLSNKSSIAIEVEIMEVQL